ncbi:MAG TPA: phenylalanine--tRNA ligase subunit beta [Candidatus Acidoferrum sp.]|nr:phenylalanine--tRNA ligase subunit beta [Candidatus Acidoferrum sp.]
MAIVAFEIKDLQKANLGRQRLEDILNKMGVEVEEVSGSEIKLNITPNRPDLLDFVGLSRAIENFTGKKPKENLYSIKNAPALGIEVRDDVAKVRPYIAGMVIRNADLSGNRLKYLINFTEKFADTYGRRRKKLAIGVHSLNAIDGNLTYTAGNEGSITPLGSSKAVSFDKIMKENAKGITYQDTVPNYGSKKVVYPFLKDKTKTIALIPITNCEQTRVTERTKDIFIDITSTSQIALRNAASVIACSFIYTGAEVYPVEIKYAKKSDTTPKLEYNEMKVSMSKADHTIGIVTGRHNVIDFANNMGYTAAKYGTSVLFYVPPYRVDVLNDQDIIEDIAIAYGYDKIVPLAISGVFSGLSNEQADYENRVASLLVGLGFTESVNSMLTDERVNFKSMRSKESRDSYVRIADAKTTTITMLRTSILPGLLENLSISSMATMPQMLFEIGKTYMVSNGIPIERTLLGFVSEHSKANFAEAKSAIGAILGNLTKDYKFEEFKDPSFIEGRCARVVVQGKALAVFGEVHPEVLLNFKIEEPVVAGEMIISQEVDAK